MILGVYAVFDNAAKAYGRPFFVQTDGLALRGFIDEVNRQAEDNQLYKHPHDFDLYRLGTFDDETGQFENELHRLMHGKQVRT